MNVIAFFDPFITDAKVFEADGVQKVDSIEELYAKADYLSLHIPATEQTKEVDRPQAPSPRCPRAPRS